MLCKSFLTLAAFIATAAVSVSAATTPIDTGVKCGNLGHLREHPSSQHKTEHHIGHKKDHKSGHKNDHKDVQKTHHKNETSSHTEKPKKDCDKKKEKSGIKKDKDLQTSDDKVFYVAPGKGSCNITYRDMSMVACLDNYWMNATEQNSCQRFVKVTNPLTNITVQVQALDTCGAAGGTFGNNDIYLSKKPFMMLSGANATATLNAGNLGANVTWEFVQASCESCYQGILARDHKHKPDNCKGPDALGNMRCGRKHGDQRVLGSKALAQVCTPDYKCSSEKN